MTEIRSEFLQTMHQRGFLRQCTDEAGLDARLNAGVVAAYIGFDCTADSLHVGSLMPIMMLRWLQKTGHKPIVLMGGGTTRVGDPSGKDDARRLLTDADIAANMVGIRSIFDKFLRFGDGPTDAVMMNNADWLDELAYIPFLREVGRHFSVNRMLSFDSVKLRLERQQPLSFLEFNYMILQAYDFMQLSRRMGCRLQMGGSDQWGNIVNGIELARRIDGAELFGLTSPLLTTAGGEKMGKTADGAVWLNEDRLSAYDYWQFWRNTADADVGLFLKLFTELPMADIARLETLQGQETNAAKKALADAATTLAHGADAAGAAADTACQAFEQGAMAEGLRVYTIKSVDLANGVGILDAFVRAGLAGSNSEVRRLIANGGARFNGHPLEDPQFWMTAADLPPDGVVKLSAGRKKHVLLRST